MGAIGSTATKQLLHDHLHDGEPIVAHSCLVALDMLAYEESGAFEYADTGSKQQ